MLKRLRLLGKARSAHWRNLSTAASVPRTSSEQTEGIPIRIPARIKRKPTDLLKALASTVNNDPTGLSYSFVDDPVFSPTKAFEAQNFAMSKELGRKAAKYFATQYPTLFMYDEDEPRMMAFRPTQRPTSENADDEESLNDRIDRLWVRSALAVYENARARNQSISTHTLLKLLELLSYYNNDDPSDVFDTSTENWYSHLLNPPPRKSWAEDGVAMQIYDSLPEPKEPRATAAIICGMLKYFSVQKGYEMWQSSRETSEEMRLKDVRVYEALIKYGVERLKAVNAERWDLITELFKAMAEDGVRPTLQVFNAAFEILTKATRWQRTEETARRLLQEMQSVGLQPSLGTYYCILRIFSTRPTLGATMNGIINRLERSTNERVFLDELDGKFFTEAMMLCCDRLRDRELAMRLHRLLKSGNNYLFMTNAEAEEKYYTRLLRFLLTTEDTKTFYERYYQRIVPRYLIPNTGFLIGFIHSVEMSESFEYLPIIVNEAVLYGRFHFRGLIWELLCTALRAPIDQLEKGTTRKLVEMAKDIYQRIELQYEWLEHKERLEKRYQVKNIEEKGPEENARDNRPKSKIRLEWTADIMASLALVCAKGGDIKGAWSMYSRLIPLTEEELSRKTIDRVPVIGEVPEMIAVEMLDHFIKASMFEESYAALRVIARMDNVTTIKRSAKKIKENIATNAVQLAKLENYLTLKDKEDEEGGGRRKMKQEKDGEEALS